MDMERIRAICASELAEKSSHPWKDKGNKYQHGLRVASIAVKMREMLYPDEPSYDDKLRIAGWFHDVCNGSDEHQEKGAVRTRELLGGIVPDDILEEICRAISVHDMRGRQGGTPLLNMLQDADLLDHLGTYDIWMCSVESGRDKLTTPECVDRFKARYEEYAGYRALLNYEESRLICDRKTEMFRAFTEMFDRESRGELY